jgi:hypothetical protein
MSKNLLDNGTVLALGVVGVVAAIGVAAQRGVYGSRSIGPTDAELRAVGRYTKSVDPDQKRYAREAGQGTGDLAIGKYVYSHYDEDSFAELLDHVREQGMVKTGKGSRAKRISAYGDGDETFAAGSSLAATGNLADLVGSEGDDFRTSHLRGKAEQLAEAIKNLVRDMNGREPRGYGSSAFIVPNSHGRLRGTVLVLGFDGGDLFPYMNRDYGDKTKYHAMQDLLRRMGYGWEYATRDRREANVYKLFTDENGPILSGEGNR